jgi:hypothetical protein
MKQLTFLKTLIALSIAMTSLTAVSGCLWGHDDHHDDIDHHNDHHDDHPNDHPPDDHPHDAPDNH